MGRRALRPINAALDLAPHLSTFEELPQPWDAAALFGRNAPLEVEVGSGKGLFLEGAAAARPETNFLGSEIAHKYARYAAARLARRELRNARLLTGDAMRLFDELFPDGSLAAVHVYFPDPWWKKRHHKRRVMNEKFVLHVERTLVPGGRLHFWSDVAEYFDQSVELLRTTTRLTGPFEVPEKLPEHDLDFRTHFERRMRQHGAPVYRSEFVKSIEGIAAEPPAVDR